MTRTTRELLTRLEQATICCHPCGTQWGVSSNAYSTQWMAVCPICGTEGPVTETRDYAYLITGRRKLAQQLEQQR